MKTIFSSVRIKCLIVCAAVISIVLSTLPLVAGADSSGIFDFEDGRIPSELVFLKDNDDDSLSVVSGIGGRAGKVLKFGSGATYSNLNRSVIYQNITVEPDTTYEWKFWVNPMTGYNHYFGVVAGNTISQTGNITLPVGVSLEQGPAFSRDIRDNEQNGGALNKAGTSTIDPNWKMIEEGNAGWRYLKVSFNSGSNTNVCVAYVARANNRICYFDDWEVTEYTGTDIINGDFEDGLNGYTYTTAAAVSTQTVHSGAKAAQITGSADQYFSTTVNLKKNTDYMWRFWAKAGLPEQHGFSVETIQGAAITSIIESTAGSGTVVQGSDFRHKIVGDGDWNEYTITFNSGDNEKARLKYTAVQTGLIYTDDWLLKECIEIGTIVNGGFEDGLNGYSETTGAKVSSDDKKSGDYSVLLDVPAGSKFYQTVSVEPGAKYRWTFWLKSNSGNTGNHLIGAAKGGDPTRLLPSTISTLEGNGRLEQVTKLNERPSNGAFEEWHYIMDDKSDWARFSVEFSTLDSDKVNLTMYCPGARKVYMDDWQLEKVETNEVTDGGFEDGCDQYIAEGLTAGISAQGKYFGNNGLEMAGAGKLTRTVAVSPYSEYVWTFYFKNSDQADGYFGVYAADKQTLFASDISVLYGSGTVSQVSFAQDRADSGFSAYHKVSSDGTWSKYSVKFKSGENMEVTLAYFSDADTTAYTDEWILEGEMVFGEGVLLNKGFELGNTYAYTTDKAYTAEIVTDVTHSGNYAAKIKKDSTGGLSFFSNTVSVKKNSDYVWSFWVKLATNSPVPIGSQVAEYGKSDFFAPSWADKNAYIDPGFDWLRIRYSDDGWHQYKMLISTGNREKLDLSLVVFAASAEFYTDDWELEYIGDTDTTESDTVFNLDFENENMTAQLGDKSPWARTDEDSYSGNYSMKYNGKTINSNLEMVFYNERGFSQKITFLKANTTYRFSLRFRGDGERPQHSYFQLKVENSNSHQVIHNQYYDGSDKQWHYLEFTFTTGTTGLGHNFRFFGASNGLPVSIYLDDIKLEAISDKTTDIDPADSVVCGDDNLIPDGAVNATAVGSAWNQVVGLTVVNGSGAIGDRFIKPTGEDGVTLRLELRPYGVYNFAASYRTSALTQALLGLSLDREGTAFNNSIFSITDTGGSWQRSAYTFTAPASGMVYLYIKGGTPAIEIDELALVALLPNPVTPKDMTANSGGAAADGTVSIWDLEYEFDFDWNTKKETPADYYYTDDDNYDDDYNDSDSKKTSSVKKMLRVKKSVLVSKGEPGVSALWIVVACVSAVLVAASLGFLIFSWKRRKKSQNL